MAEFTQKQLPCPRQHVHIGLSPCEWLRAVLSHNAHATCQPLKGTQDTGSGVVASARWSRTPLCGLLYAAWVRFRRAQRSVHQSTASSDDADVDEL